MRSFKQQADRIVELIDSGFSDVEDLLPLLRKAAEQYHRENPELSRRCFDVDIQDEYVDFAFWNPDVHQGQGENQTFIRNQKTRDRFGDKSLLSWVRSSIRRLAEVELQWYQLNVWYQFKRDSLYPGDSKLSRDNAKWSKTGLRRIEQGVYAVRHDAISQYVKSDLRDESTFVVYRG